jgi:hypothetical protein
MREKVIHYIYAIEKQRKKSIYKLYIRKVSCKSIEPISICHPLNLR